jgi:hypothetical protein
MSVWSEQVRDEMAECVAVAVSWGDTALAERMLEFIRKEDTNDHLGADGP